MAKTIQQAGGNTGDRTMPTSQEITATSSIRPSEIQAGSALAGDLMSIMGEGSKTVQTGYDASVKAANRVALDSSVHLGTALIAIDGATDYSDPESIREAKKQNEIAYQELGRKTFDNEDAQGEFDKNYHSANLNSVGKINVALEKKALELDDTIQTENLLGGIDTQLNSGIGLTKNGFDASVDVLSSGKLNKEDSQKLIATRSSTAFETKIVDGPVKVLSKAGYDVDDGFTDEVEAQVFENEFGAYGKYKDGEIVWNEDLDEKAKSAVLASWRPFLKNVASLEVDGINKELMDYKVARESNKKQVVNGKTLPADIKANNDKLLKMVSQIKNLTTSEKENIYKDIKSGNEEFHKSTQVNSVFNATPSQMKSFTENGVKYYDTEGVEQTASAEYVTNQIKAQQSIYSDGITSNAVGSKGYEQSISDAIELEYRSGVKNPVVVSFEKGATGTSMFTSSSDIDKSIDIASKKQSRGTANTMLKNTAYRAELESLRARYKSGNLTETEFINKANFSMKTMRASVFSRIDSGEVKKNWISAVASAQDQWFKNTEIDMKTVDALLFQYASEGGDPNATEEEMADYIKANIVEFTGLGTGMSNSLGSFFFGVSKDSTSAGRMKDTQGEPLEDYVYEDSVVNIVDQYNEEHPDSKIAVSDIRVDSPFNATAGTDQVVWNVSVLKNGNKIPIKSYDGDSLIKMAAWESKRSAFASDGYASRLSTLEKNQEFVKLRKEAQEVANNPIPTDPQTSDMASAESTPTDMFGVNSKELRDSQALNPIFRVKRTSGKTNEELASGIKGMKESDINSLVSIESGGKYDAMNKGSGAYGKYQFIPDTAYEAAKKIGYDGAKPTNSTEMPDELKEFMTPENQDKMFTEFTNKNISGLKEANIPVTPLNVYLVHQQGLRGAKEILSDNKLSETRYKNMVYNLGLNDADEKALLGMYGNDEMVSTVKQQWLDMYKKKMA